MLLLFPGNDADAEPGNCYSCPCVPWMVWPVLLTAQTSWSYWLGWDDHSSRKSGIILCCRYTHVWLPIQKFQVSSQGPLVEEWELRLNRTLDLHFGSWVIFSDWFLKGFLPPKPSTLGSSPWSQVGYSSQWGNLTSDKKPEFCCCCCFFQVVRGGQEAGVEDVPLTCEIRKQTNPSEAGMAFVLMPNFRSRLQGAEFERIWTTPINRWMFLLSLWVLGYETRAHRDL